MPDHRSGPTDPRSAARSGRLEAEFREASPRLFGGLLNVLSRTLALLPTVADDGLSARPTFTALGRAAAISLGFTLEAFDAAMKEAEARSPRSATDSPLAAAILLFARKNRRWEGGPYELCSLNVL